MPLRDHFRSPLDDETSWDGFHGGWPMVIVQTLSRHLPKRYVAAPQIHLGAVEIDVAAYDSERTPLAPVEPDNGGGVATAVWAPARPTLSIATELPMVDDYEVRVYDSKRGRRLVAAIEIVSPTNKDRPEHRGAFIAKCAALLQQRVSVAIVDLVTTRSSNLYAELLELIAKTDPALPAEPPPLYAISCRHKAQNGGWLFESWSQMLALGQPLPTLPLWLADDLPVPLELEASYEETCRVLRIV